MHTLYFLLRWDQLRNDLHVSFFQDDRHLSEGVCSLGTGFAPFKNGETEDLQLRGRAVGPGKRSLVNRERWLVSARRDWRVVTTQSAGAHRCGRGFPET